MNHPIVSTRPPTRRGRPLLTALLALAICAFLAPSAGAAIGEHHYLPALSHVESFSGAKALATDSAGDLYVADSDGKVKVFGPGGAAIAEFAPSANGGPTLGLVVDSSGDVYVLGGGKVYRYKPSTPLPPTAGTTYSTDTSLNGTGLLLTSSVADGLAIDPTTQDVYVNEGDHIAAYTPTGTLISAQIGAGLTTEGLPFEGIAVYGAEHRVYGIAQGSGRNELQSLEILEATGGTYTLTFAGQTTTPLAYEAGAGAIAAALEALPAIGTGNAVVRCGNEEPEYLECEILFRRALARTDVDQIEVDGAGLVGPAPDATTGTTFAGESGTPETVYVLNAAGDAIVRSFDGSDSPAGGFGPESPRGPINTEPKIAIDQSNGNVFVGDVRYHHAVDEFDQDGNYVSQFDPTFGSSIPPSLTPEVALAVDNGATSPNQRDIYVASYASVFAFGPTVQGYPLTVEKGTNGGTVESTPAGILCGSACDQQSTVFEEGTVTLKASVAPGARFLGWAPGDCEAEPSGGTECVVTLDGAKTVRANFVRTFPLAVAPDGPSGSGTVTSSPAGIDCGQVCEAEFDQGATVTLKATAAAGFRLAGWASGDCAAEPSGGAECVIAMDAAKLVEPRFVPVFKLTVSRSGDGAGTVTSTPAAIDCGATCAAELAAGEAVTLTAVAASGSHFVGWTGDCTGTGACRVAMTAARAVGAEFAPDAPATRPGGEGPKAPPGGPPAPAPIPAGVPRVAPVATVRHGSAILRISCSKGGTCSGRVKLIVKAKGGKFTAGTARYAVGPGRSKSIAVKLTRRARGLLARGAVKAEVGGAGLGGTVTLKAASK